MVTIWCDIEGKMVGGGTLMGFVVAGVVWGVFKTCVGGERGFGEGGKSVEYCSDEYRVRISWIWWDRKAEVENNDGCVCRKCR